MQYVKVCAYLDVKRRFMMLKPKSNMQRRLRYTYAMETE